MIDYLDISELINIGNREWRTVKCFQIENTRWFVFALGQITAHQKSLVPLQNGALVVFDLLKRNTFDSRYFGVRLQTLQIIVMCFTVRAFFCNRKQSD